MIQEAMAWAFSAMPEAGEPMKGTYAVGHDVDGIQKEI